MQGQKLGSKLRVLGTEVTDERPGAGSRGQGLAVGTLEGASPARAQGSFSRATGATPLLASPRSQHMEACALWHGWAEGPDSPLHIGLVFHRWEVISHSASQFWPFCGPVV